MTIASWLKKSSDKLSSAGTGSANLDALILLEDELHKDRSWMLAHPEQEIAQVRVNKLEKQIVRRAGHEPLAYIRGFTDFYGRRIKVNKRVLEPRPESETMIDLLKEVLKNHPKLVSEPSPFSRTRSWKIADVGTGSGALGITAALELHNHNVDLLDIDASALAVAKHNCALHELHLRTVKRDLLRNSHKSYDVILANLPYIPDHWKLHPSVKMEPRIALYGGKDGLDLYRRLFEQLTHFSWKPKYIFTESLPPQHKELAHIADGNGFNKIKSRDFIQVFTSS